MDENQPLNGKAALITGASRGIGFAIARMLGRLGAKVCLCGRDAAKLELARSGLEREGSSAIALPANLTQASEIASLVEQSERSVGAIEILVNNAGTGYFAPFYQADEATWNKVLDTNLKAVFLLSKSIAAGMVARRSGHIINIASLAGKNAFAGGGVYCASKWGLLGLTECMAEDLRPFGIRVTAICPGTVETDFSPHSGKDPRKMLQPDDIAHVVEMLVTQAPRSFISEVLIRPTQKP
jgi:NAD(P)-dependent dehydrogenase (short-subunit alcohol dehydrogenase family)